MAVRRFAPKDVLRETFLTHLAVAPDGSAVVYGRRTIEDGAYKTRLWRVPMSSDVKRSPMAWACSTWRPSIHARWRPH